VRTEIEGSGVTNPYSISRFRKNDDIAQRP
jgi:hypothetical protein